MGIFPRILVGVLTCVIRRFRHFKRICPAGSWLGFPLADATAAGLKDRDRFLDRRLGQHVSKSPGPG